MKKYVWLLGVIITAGFAAEKATYSYFSADTQRYKKIESTKSVVNKIFLDLAERDHFPGLAFGIVADGKLVYTGQTGWSNVAHKTAATDESLFRIASMTKSFVAMAILILRDQGKLNLDDPAANYVTELNKSTALTKDAGLITIRHLLTHSAGFPEDNPWGDRQMADTEQEFSRLLQGGLSFSTAAGTEYEYSNLGFAILGRIITRVSGKPYQQFISEKILQPLKMQNTVWEYSQADAQHLALGYNWIEQQWLNVPMLHDGSFAAIGGLITSVPDFGRYMALHLAAWPPRDEANSRILSRSSLREMHQCWRVYGQDLSFTNGAGKLCPVINGYGYGLRWLQDCQGRVVVGHGGGLPGFGSHWRIMKDYGIGVVVLANRTYADLGKTCYAVLDTIVTLAGLQPRRPAVSSILQTRKQDLLKVLPDWQVTDMEPFADNFFLDFSIDSLRQRCGRMYHRAGKIIKISEITPRNHLRGSFTLYGEKADIELFFTLTPENPARIQQLEFKAISQQK
jgi:CubicO group peptidase (beta-lactamase class C family)